MVLMDNQNIEYLVADTTAFIQNAPLQNVGKRIITCQEVVDEIINKRQLRRLVVLPYDLEIKNVDPENVQIVTEFSKKTGDYPSLSAIDIKVMALTYQLEKEHVGTEHLHNQPVMQQSVNVITRKSEIDTSPVVAGFYIPENVKNAKEKSKHDGKKEIETTNLDKLLSEKFETLECKDTTDDYKEDDILVTVEENVVPTESDDDSDDDDKGWITPSNIQKAKEQINSETMEAKQVKVACMTTDFAMQNVLKQINLNVAALDGRLIKQLRTYILRCYTCFNKTSIMTKLFCMKCGNKTLKRVAVSLDENGIQCIHINARRPLTARGKKFSLPTIKGGKHSNNPLLVADQPVPDQRPTRLARTKTNAMDEDYIAGYSPFVMRDVTSKSAQLKIRPVTEIKHWMRKNPNEAVRRRKQ